MIELAAVIEQAQQERADVGPGSVLVPAEPRHDAIGRALVLDLEHRPLARLVRAIEALGDDTVETGALEEIEPFGGGRPIDVAKAFASVTGARVAAIPTTMSGAEMTGIHRLPAEAESRAASMVRPPW